MTERELLDKILADLRARGGAQDAVGPQMKTTTIVAKYDKTDVTTPGVEGLTPFETIVAEDGVVIERRTQGG